MANERGMACKFEQRGQEDMSTLCFGFPPVLPFSLWMVGFLAEDRL